MGQLTVQQILQRGYAAFEQCHPLPANAVVDALHIAIAAVNGMQYLLT
jgi:hypothetical protein